MSRVILLLKYYMKMPKTKGKINMPTPVKYLIFAFAIIMMSMGFATAIGAGYGILKSIGKQGLLISMILTTGSIFTLVIGLFSVLNTFFLAEDTDAFLPLPFKATEIVLSKLISNLLQLYIYSLIIVAPLIVYGMVSNAGVMFYVFIVFAYIFNPIIPMFFAFIISSILMSVANLGRHKDKIKVIFTVLLIALIVGVNVIFKGNDLGKQAAGMATSKAEFFKVISFIFINIKLETRALLNWSSLTGIINMIMVVVVIIIFFIILYIVSEKLYLKSLKGLGDVGKRKSKMKKVKIKTSSILKTLVIKEFRVVFRTPVFFVNSVVMLFYIPVLYGVIIFSSALHSAYWKSGVVVIGLTMCAIGFGMASGSSAGTSLSREGNNILVSKYIPVNYKTQALAKIISSFIINLLIVVLGIGVLIFEKVGLETFVLSVILQILTCFFVTIIGVLGDYISPKVAWETEKSLYRGRFRNFGNTIIVVITGAIVFAISLLTKSILITFIANIAILIIAIGICAFMLKKNIIKTYRAL